MNCREMEERMAQAVRRGERAAEAVAVADHLSHCGACRAFAAQLDQVAAPLAEFAALARGAGTAPDGAAMAAARSALVARLIAAAPPSGTATGGDLARALRQPGALARRLVCAYPAAAAVTAAAAVSLFGLVLWNQTRAQQPSPRLVARQPAANWPATQGMTAPRHSGPAHSMNQAPRAIAVLTPIVQPSRAAATGRRREFGDFSPRRPVARSPRRPLAPSVHPGDDLTNLNGDPRPVGRRWEMTPRDEWIGVERGLERLAPRGDDFVQIPFPRLASTSDRQIVAAAESYRRDALAPAPPFPRLPSAPDRHLVAALENYKREAAVVDVRLAREVTVQQKAAALSDVCDRLRTDTGIQLAAGRSVADEKITLLCQKQPLREVMRQLSRPFGYTWLRTGKPGEYKYELVQDLRSQLLEEDLRSKDRNAAMIALDREMSQYRPFLGLTPEQARARARTASPLEKESLERLAGPGWGAIQMYFRLSPNDLTALRSGQSLRFTPDPGPREYPLPPDVARGVLQSPPPTRDVVGPTRAGGGEAPGRRAVQELDVQVQQQPGAPDANASSAARAEVQLGIEPSELGQFMLIGGAGVTMTGPQGSRRRMSRDTLAVGESPTVRSPQNGAVNAKLARDPALRPRVSVRPQPSCGRDPSPARRGGTEQHGPRMKANSADVLEALHRATGMPIVADYYTRLHSPGAVTAQNQPLFEALNQLADRMRLRWNKEGGWLQFRSSSYFHDRLKEVPNRLLNGWAAARRQHGGLRLEELIEIAQLSDTQLDAASMAEGARACFGLVEWDLARHRDPRPHLRYLASFTPQQRQTARRGQGLPFTGMSLAQQQQFIALAFGSRPDQLQSLEELTGAALRVDYSRPGEFEWRAVAAGGRGDGATGRRGDPTEPAAVRERTREGTLAAARRIDPQAAETQIVPSELALTIVYAIDGPEGRSTPLAMRATPGGVSVTSRRAGRGGGGG